MPSKEHLAEITITIQLSTEDVEMRSLGAKLLHKRLSLSPYQGEGVCRRVGRRYQQGVVCDCHVAAVSQKENFLGTKKEMRDLGKSLSLLQMAG